LLNWQINPGDRVVASKELGDMRTTDLKRKFLATLLTAMVLPFAGFGKPMDLESDDDNGQSAAIISRFLQATQSHEDVLRGASMEVEIDASVPRLKENGKLRALRSISKVGQITYRVLGFQGDNTVKKEVIGRFLQAEQQSQGDQNLAISPANYKFKYKGEKATQQGKKVFVFALSPRKKKIGLFKGEMWLDASTYLPVYEKGRFVKNPSIFFKQVNFERAFAIRNGLAVPSYMNSTIDTRVIGKVELNVSYSKLSETPQDMPSENSEGQAVLLHSSLAR
jgi:hypothetical protein